MNTISDFTISLGVAVGKIAICAMVPRTAILLFGSKEIALLQSLEQDLNAQHIALKVPLAAGCALALFHKEIVSVITGAQGYAEQVFNKYYAPSVEVQSTVQPEHNQFDCHKDMNVLIHHNTSNEELICQCHANEGLQGDLVG